MQESLIIFGCIIALILLVTRDYKDIKSDEIIEPYFDLKGNIKGFRRVRR